MLNKSNEVSESRKRPRRSKTPIEPIHVEELLAGAGMNGFLGILDTPAPTPHLQELIGEGHTHSTYRPGADSPQAWMRIRRDRLADRDAEPSGRERFPLPRALAGPEPKQLPASDLSLRVASVVLKLDALTELMVAKPEDAGSKTSGGLGPDQGSDPT